MSWPSGQNEPSSHSHDFEERQAAAQLQWERNKAYEQYNAPPEKGAGDSGSGGGGGGGGGSGGGCGGCGCLLVPILLIAGWNWLWGPRQPAVPPPPIRVVDEPVDAPWDPGNAPIAAPAQEPATPATENGQPGDPDPEPSPDTKSESDRLVRTYLTELGELVQEYEARLQPDLEMLDQLREDMKAGRLSKAAWLEQTNAINQRIGPDRAALTELGASRTRVRSSYSAFKEGKLTTTEADVVRDATKRLEDLRTFRATRDLAAFKRDNNQSAEP
ncbi:MAG: hypothetical protein KF777_20425 [Planctomycetaceae bacterium]|nr:hypothetical protein [Planctomycetaceae bacterium]